MKKLLLVSTALVGVALLSSPASAAVKLELGGYFSGYGMWVDNDEPAGASFREFDLRRDTEVHVTGETTLDNGLTVGFHTEQALGGATLTDEAYAYFSGGWGRVNLGSEDSAAYLLQVGAPSADSNTDGMRVYMQGFNVQQDLLAFGALSDGGVAVADFVAISGGGAFFNTPLTFDTTVDYDQANFLNTDRITYLTPKFNGFQAGVSYASEQGQNVVGNNIAAMAADATTTAVFANDTGAAVAGATLYEDLWDVAARWDGEFQGLGIAFGGGYSNADIEGTGDLDGAALTIADRGTMTLSDDFSSWNGGLSLAWNGFTLGGSYKHDDTGYSGIVADDATAAVATGNADIDRKTWVVGLGWDNGPYHLGASYLDQNTDIDGITNNTGGAAGATDFSFVGSENEIDKLTIGAGYTFGPGMTFRGSVAWGEYDALTGGAGAVLAFTRTDQDFTQVAIGTEIDF